METINPVPTYCQCREPSLSQLSAKTSQTQLAAISNSQSIGLDLMTEEGDTVSLSIDAKAFALYAQTAQAVYDGNAMSREQAALQMAQVERDISLTVEGDLNRAERREIRKAIRTIKKMMNRFVKGKLDPMGAGAQQLANLDTIESLDLSMSYARQVLVAEQRQSSTVYNQFGQAAPQLPDATSEAAQDNVITAARALAVNMADVVDKAPVDNHRILEMTERMFKDFRRQARRMGRFEGKLMDHIRDLFQRAVNRSTDTEPAQHVLTAAEHDD